MTHSATINIIWQAAFDGNRPVLLAGLVSLSLIITALGFEHIGGLVPCKLCLTQRLPHYGLIALAMVSVIHPAPQILWRPFAAILAGITGVIGIQHVGVEQGWWQGPQGCSSSIGDGSSLADLTSALLATPVVRCDEIAWSLLGISMAGWNSIISFGLVLFLVCAIFKLKGVLRNG